MFADASDANQQIRKFEYPNSSNRIIRWFHPNDPNNQQSVFTVLCWKK